MTVETSDWSSEIQKHACRLSGVSLRQRCADKDHVKRQIRKLGPLTIDFSKNYIDQELIHWFKNHLEKQGWNQYSKDLFSGAPINSTENRPVMHWLLRATQSNLPEFNEVKTTFERMRQACRAIHKGEWVGATGQPFTDIVNLGVGGSDLGPRLVCQALDEFALPECKVHFVANIDGSDIHQALQGLSPHNTLFIVTSKSFSTLETLQNATTARDWLKAAGIESDAHWIGVTSQVERAVEFGLTEKNIFPMWDWVGGRYSVWSAVGLSIMLRLGIDQFDAFLSGGAIVDEHMQETPVEENSAFIMALLSTLYINGFSWQSQAIIPYDHRLRSFPDYLQQLEMESNGKSVNRKGENIDYQTAPIIWGGVGSNTQHSFHQLLHQGKISSPVDFLIALNPSHHYPEHHRLLIANMLAQAQALMQGKQFNEIENEIKNSDESVINPRIIMGGKPSTIIGFDRLCPKVIGTLIALYEYKVFIQSCAWQINPFDQWGVELGKNLCGPIADALLNKASATLDPSTNFWINEYKKNSI